MKKSIIAILILMFGISLASAAGPADGTGQYHDENVAAGGLNGEGMMNQAQAGMYTGPQGQQMNINMVNNRYQLRVGEFSADCDCNLSQEQVQNRTRLYAGLSNGRNAEIKVMPDVASETALQRLRLRNCSENCSIELREVGSGAQAQLAYEIQTQKRAKVFGMFGTQMQVQAQVNAETGEVIRVNKPWWSFLASEENETEE